MKQSRDTKQKELLQKTLTKMDSVFSAQELHNKAKLHDEQLGVATVYRFLAAQHELHSFTCNRRTVYAHHNSSHCHFTCTRCGTISHINIKKADFLGDLNVCHFQLDVHGVCKECEEKKK